MRTIATTSGNIRVQKPRAKSLGVAQRQAALAVVELDRAVERIRDLDRQFVANAYELGTALVDCHDRGIWRLRLDDRGTPKYAHWQNFVAAELTITRNYAYSLMKIATCFSREEIERANVGTAKLMLLLRVKDPAERAKLLDEAKSKRLSVRQVKARVGEVAPVTAAPKDQPSEARSKLDQLEVQSFAGEITGFTAEGLNVRTDAGTVKIPLPKEVALDYLGKLGKRVVFTICLRG